MVPVFFAVVLSLVAQHIGLSICAKTKVTVITTHESATGHVTGGLKFTHGGIPKQRRADAKTATGSTDITTLSQWVDNSGKVWPIPIYPSDDSKAAQESSEYFAFLSGMLLLPSSYSAEAASILAGLTMGHHVSITAITAPQVTSAPGKRNVQKTEESDLEKRQKFTDVATFSETVLTDTDVFWADPSGVPWPVPIFSGDTADSDSSSWWSDISASLTHTVASGGLSIPSDIITFYQALIANQTVRHHLVTETMMITVPGSAKKVGQRDAPAVVTQIVEESIIVMLNPAGQPITTVTVVVPGPIEQSSESAAPCSTPSSPSATTPAPTTTITTQPQIQPQQSSSLLAANHAASQSAPSAAASSSNPPATGQAITYSPYLASSGCRTAAQVKTDITFLLQKNPNITLLRLYGVDCNQISNVLAALPPNSNIQLFAGLFNLATLVADTSSLISQVNNNWASIHTASVGNELVQFNQASVQQVVSAVGTARSQLQAAGYKGPVVAVDTMVTVTAHPELCQASDYCAINCHAYFDGNVVAANAGPWVLGWAKNVSASNGGKKTVVTESGWPTCGGTNGAAVPGEGEMLAAVKSLGDAFAGDEGEGGVILYSAFNTNFLRNEADTHGTATCWGVYGDAPAGA